MSSVINPCHCGYEGELAGINHQGVYYSLECPKCNRSVEAFTMDGLFKNWNKPAEPEKQKESGDE